MCAAVLAKPARSLPFPALKAIAMVLGRVKRWVLAMLALIGALRVAPVPPREERGAFDPPCAPRRSEPVGTKGVP